MRYDYRRRVHGILTDRTDTATTENVLFDCSDLITATILSFLFLLKFCWNFVVGLRSPSLVALSCASLTVLDYLLSFLFIFFSLL